jgi:hypothetical protein
VAPLFLSKPVPFSSNIFSAPESQNKSISGSLFGPSSSEIESKDSSKNIKTNSEKLKKDLKSNLEENENSPLKTIGDLPSAPSLEKSSSLFSSEMKTPEFKNLTSQVQEKFKQLQDKIEVSSSSGSPFALPQLKKSTSQFQELNKKTDFQKVNEFSEAKKQSAGVFGTSTGLALIHKAEGALESKASLEKERAESKAPCSISKSIKILTPTLAKSISTAPKIESTNPFLNHNAAKTSLPVRFGNPRPEPTDSKPLPGSKFTPEAQAESKTLSQQSPLFNFPSTNTHSNTNTGPFFNPPSPSQPIPTSTPTTASTTPPLSNPQQSQTQTLNTNTLLPTQSSSLFSTHTTLPIQTHSFIHNNNTNTPNPNPSLFSSLNSSFNKTSTGLFYVFCFFILFLASFFGKTTNASVNPSETAQSASASAPLTNDEDQAKTQNNNSSVFGSQNANMKTFGSQSSALFPKTEMNKISLFGTAQQAPGSGAGGAAGEGIGFLGKGSLFSGKSAPPSEGNSLFSGTKFSPSQNKAAPLFGGSLFGHTQTPEQKSTSGLYYFSSF